MAENMIEIRNVVMDFRTQHDSSKSFKDLVVNAIKGKVKINSFRAVDNVNITIKPGEVCGIIGRNGAGKSTLLKMISGVLTPTSGSIEIGGKIAPMLELGAGFDTDLTARENIYLNGAILGYSKEFLDERFDRIVEFAELEDFIDQPVRTFSSGMMMRLAFSVATQVDPEILIVDEILSVGDTHFRQKSEKRMREMMSGGTTVLMVSHALHEIRSMCNHVIWLDHGKVVLDGEPDYVCDAYDGLIELEHAPEFTVGRTLNDIQRVKTFSNNWLPQNAIYKIRTGQKGSVAASLYCPFRDLKGTEKVKLSVEGGGEIEVNITEEYTNLEVEAPKNSVVTVHVDCNYFRIVPPDTRELAIVLADTVGN